MALIAEPRRMNLLLRLGVRIAERTTGRRSERELVILATTAAQVNYWARVIQALGIPPAGFTEACRLPPI